MRHKGRLLVLSGPAGVGKGTVCKALLEKEPQIRLSVSETTRPPRPGEVDGVDYFFVSKADFEAGISAGNYLEYDHHFDRYYGTPKSYVVQQLTLGNDVLLEIDVNGAEQIKKVMPEAITIFLLPPSAKECKNRIMGRGTESDEQLRLRWERFPDEVNCAYHYDYVVINDTIDRALASIRSIIMSEKLRTPFWEDHIQALLGGN